MVVMMAVMKAVMKAAMMAVLMADTASPQVVFEELLELVSLVEVSLALAKFLMATVSLAQVPGSARAPAPASALALVLVLALA